jgi:hypothetical protein
VNEPLDSVRRIAVLRCNALGDYLMATPALSALRYTFPHAELTLHAGRWHADFLSGRPGPEAGERDAAAAAVADYLRAAEEDLLAGYGTA